jgi:hypothetical protein
MTFIIKTPQFGTPGADEKFIAALIRWECQAERSLVLEGLDRANASVSARVRRSADPASFVIPRTGDGAGG